MELSRCRVKILHILYSENATDKFHGLTVLEISEIEQKSKENTIHKNIKLLQKYGYLDEGIKAGKGKTYFLTKLGFNTIEEIFE